MRLPIRTRLALISAATMAVVLVVAGTFVYVRLRADLVAAVDAGLVPRAATIVDAIERTDEPLGDPAGAIEPDEAFAQVLDDRGRVLESTPGLVRGPLVPAAVLVGLRSPIVLDSMVGTIEEVVPARLLAVPAADRIVVVGASFEDQREALARLLRLMALGGPAVLFLAGVVGWFVAGAALRPVERMRSQAAAVSADDPDRELAVPDTGDELARLATTLNEMLDRLGTALRRERRFVSDASHELRTPLANLRSELELASRRSRTRDELLAALVSASEETDRLTRLAEDLLTLSRVDGRRLPVARESVDVASLVALEIAVFGARSTAAGVRIVSIVPDGARAVIDPARFRQALGNLLDNAVRHAPRGSTVEVEARTDGEMFTIEVRDEGVGFPAGFAEQAFEPFTRGDPSRTRDQGGSGLGLAIVLAIAQAHGGTAHARTLPGGGAAVVVSFAR